MRFSEMTNADLIKQIEDDALAREVYSRLVLAEARVTDREQALEHQRDAEPVEDIGTQEREGFWSQPIEKYTNSCPTRAPGAEPVTDRDAPAYLRSEPERRAWAIGANAHPQPAQQGSVPEGRLVDLAKSLARDVIHLEDCEDREDRRTVEDRARSIAADIQELLSTTPQPEGYGWLRLPGDANNHRCLLYTPSEEAGIEYRIVPAGFVKPVSDATHYIPLEPPTDLKRPQPPAQEGEGDEH